ncbi:MULTISPECIES: sigma-70 domain-containing protein [Clostridia]|uniref:RNA polymerase subunit sigma-70 n=1 Tax=Lacrimispora celerecrescens TaxID=29354 RepID=A0A084JQU3_9FIRM|nr:MULTISPECIES: sigma-70 domain-containing protein [Clostridia]KEZ91327.1 RNA polymerase subunit sigma-70 [Lacrimispora celerecrescens]MSS08248.1 RNA polymerase subunit sigma-70 [Clostridium sp. WB02_MRS01]
MHDDFYQMYLEEMGHIPPCTREEQEDLLKEAAEGSKEAKKRIVEGNLRAALEYAREYDGRGVLMTDLVQEANMALMMAVEEYVQEEVRQEFDSFKSQRIREALAAAVEEQQSAKQTGEELAARVNVLQQISQLLAKELGREATVEELADKMKMTVEEISGIMKIAMDAMSMNAESMDLEALAGVEGIEITEDEESEDYDFEE